ncbi:uncharacterized protein LAESUDRAFT_651034 [Laetiporus sulphureus 93-53]|uniref:LysM domain-containing protein n=1 Tax=Laetiporus sulphureus 93-53 TaxID=1314785 RepID=A0A165ES59_9APHY|nr:uncharacterized protein LAESUDRAFT_651034 [Laetiporus sulphureus 93-53]KZT07653.1 hypothetical protein LAESUDRAFT_651034 [Laetiporus sulphureus 93-53]
MSGLDRSTFLCLACSSSLPPRRSMNKAFGGNNLASDDVFLTRCCNRPICPTCISRNPRLARYNPCLHCLGGVDAVSASKAKLQTGRDKQAIPVNVDGAIRDEDVFVLDDDDPDELDDSCSAESGSPAPSMPPPAYTDSGSDSAASPLDGSSHDGVKENVEAGSQAVAALTPSSPHRYYLKPNDTLVGIALHFRVDGRILCRLNGLPPSTLRTTPHLLHTRTYLNLPPSASGIDIHDPLSDSAGSVEVAVREARRARERAEKRFQVLTKEADWRVARAYVAVADVDDPDESGELKSKSKSFESTLDMPKQRRVGGSAEGRLEERAIDRYLDDEEWEERERREGRGISIPSFPYFRDASSSSRIGDSSEKRWWRWQQ